MTRDHEAIVSVSEANEDLTGAAREEGKKSGAVAMKNDRPVYLPIDPGNGVSREMSDDEKIDAAAARIMKRYRPAFLELAK